MNSLLPTNTLEISVSDDDLKYLRAIPTKEDRKFSVRVIPSFDFLVIEINGDIRKINLGDSKRLEQELQRGNTIEMELIIGSRDLFKVNCKWKGKRLAGGGKAMTMEVIEEMKAIVKKCHDLSDAILPNARAIIKFHFILSFWNYVKR